MKKVAVLITVFNRRTVTLNSLSSLLSQTRGVPEVLFDVYLTDDGSTDGTAAAVAEEFPDVTILQGDGSLYWGGGTNNSWRAAVNSGIEYDYYLWFNDDAILSDGALGAVFRSVKELDESVIVSGAFKDDKGNVSYGGRNRDGRLISPDGSFQEVYMTNGNFVLIPRKTYALLGFIDSKFPHRGGDADYGMRARKNGIGVVLTKQYLGTTNRHDADRLQFLSYPYFWQRLASLYDKRWSAVADFIFFYRYSSKPMACLSFVAKHFFAFVPVLGRKVYKYKSGHGC